MERPANGFELLDQLREQNGKKIQNFKALSNFLDSKAREKGIPVHCQFELTPLCNFNCKMCYVQLNADQLNGQPVLSVENWKDLMYQAWQAGMFSATLTGGECLAYPGFDELYLYLHNLGCEVAVLTNGFLMDENRVRFFKKHMPSMIQVTLYGQNDDVYERVTGHRAFNTVANNIKHAVEAQLPIYISLTPNRYLGEDLIETIRIAKSLCKSVGMNSIFTTPREETGRSGQQDDADLDLYIRAYHYFNQLEGRESPIICEDNLPPFGGPYHECSECGLLCGGGRSGFAIDWKGVMKPCISMEMIRAYPLKDGFAAAWSKVNKEADSWPRVPECKGCAYDGVCNKCAANMLQFAAPGKLPVVLCEQTRDLVRQGAWRLPDCD